MKNRMTKFNLLSAALIIVSFAANRSLAQSIPLGSYGYELKALDGAYVPENILKRYIKWPYLREADVMYKRRIWQEIDLRQKFNHHLYFPITEISNRKNLFQVIRHYTIHEPYLTAYSTGELGNNDAFLKQYVMTPSQVAEKLSRTKTVPKYNDAGTEIIGYEDITTPIDPSEITRYRIKEDWIWDRQRSERYIRIIAIAPMIDVQDADGNIEGYEPLFWLQYDPECRAVFCMEEAYNLFNDAQRRTFDDIFEKRYFSSYIVKEDNVFDRQISSYARGIDALAESERIQEILFNMEHDIWHY